MIDKKWWDEWKWKLFYIALWFIFGAYTAYQYNNPSAQNIFYWSPIAVVIIGYIHVKYFT
jgi:hypothetical protein